MSHQKILHVITGLGNGGAEAVLFRLIESDIRRGSSHHVISLTDRGMYSERLNALGVCVYTLDCPRGRVTLSGLIKLFQHIKVVRPDVVQTWMYHADLIGGVIARLAGARAVVWGIRHANLDREHNSSATLRVVRLCAFLSRWVPRQIVSCSAQATRLHQDVGYQADKFVQIPNGYNMQRFNLDVNARDLVRAEIAVKKDEFVLGMVARFDTQKDHRNLVDALGQFKRSGLKFTCLLVGVGMDAANEMLHSWIKKADVADRIKLLGPRGDIPAIMNAVDVHVLSSLGEAFPNVLAEAMACGTPCVTTDVGDAAVIVAEHGWVVKPRDANALVQGLMQAHDSFAGDKAAWQRLQAACRAHIMNNFELEQMCERYRQAWRACMQA